MNDKKTSIDRLRISRFKLDALLNITLSINANLPTEELLSKYESILRNNLGIGKILIFKHSVKWECLLNGGFSKELETGIDVESQLLKFTEPAFRNEGLDIEGVDIVIPVYNNYVPLAFVLIGDIEEEGKGMARSLSNSTLYTISSIILLHETSGF
jgi:sigma-B regulation protein RsbU (phosphoserine phosphatase)